MKKLTVLALAVMMTLSSVAFSAGNKVYVDVNGLVCDFCARALEKVFGKQESVEDIKVDLGAKVITIALKEGQSLGEGVIKQLILDAGYDVSAIRYEEE